MIEGLDGIELRQFIGLDHRQGRDGLHHLDDPVDTGPNNGGVIGLCNEVSGAKLQTSYLILCFFTAGGDDHRDRRKQFVPLLLLKKLETCTNRHIYVQKHKRKVVYMPAEKVKTDLTILCIHQIVIVLENNPQNRPVQLVVFHHQNLSLAMRNDTRFGSYLMRDRHEQHLVKHQDVS